jgi:hypothetical protein
MFGNSWSRRDFVVTAGAAGALGAFTGGEAEATAASAPSPAGAVAGNSDPRNSNLGIVKLMASLDPEPAPWWFAGILYAQQGESRPLPFVRCEGCEQYRTERQGDGSYVMHGSTLTFFRDVESREWLDEFANPITGKRVEVRPNVLQSSGSGGFVYPADGSAGYFFGKMGNTGQLAYKPVDETAAAGVPRTQPARPKGEMSWHLVGDTVLATTSRAIETPAQPWVETSTIMTTRAAFFDPKVRSTPATGTATYLSPWLKWMQMEGVPGHLVWHAPSVKLASLAGLPPEYRARATQKDLLKVFE